VEGRVSFRCCRRCEFNNTFLSFYRNETWSAYVQHFDAVIGGPSGFSNESLCHQSRAVNLDPYPFARKKDWSLDSSEFDFKGVSLAIPDSFCLLPKRRSLLADPIIGLISGHCQCQRNARTSASHKIVSITVHFLTELNEDCDSVSIDDRRIGQSQHGIISKSFGVQ
jgi:hypothetical protein